MARLGGETRVRAWFWTGTSAAGSAARIRVKFGFQERILMLTEQLRPERR
jgi:hypothetical protein